MEATVKNNTSPIIGLIYATVDPCWDVVYLNAPLFVRNKVGTYVQPAVLVDFKIMLRDTIREKNSGI